jgi:peptide deformylase
MAIRELRVFGDEILKKVCRTVPEVNDHIRLLLGDLSDTLQATPGCTVLAANQLGLRRRLVVANLSSGIVRLINPVITRQSGEQDCLESDVSVKNIPGMTIRPKHITVEALDETGSPVTITADDDDAQILCRGIDYLDGKAYVEKVYRYVDEG